MHRRQYLGTGAGLLATTTIGVPAAAQEDDDETDESDDGDNADESAFETFANDLEAALAEVDITLVSHCECPRFAELVVTTQGESTDDETFHEELATVAGEYASFVDRADSPPAFGVLVYAYDTPDAATESITDPFARYSVLTEWAEDALETEDSEAYLTEIMLTVNPPISNEETDSPNDSGDGGEGGDAQIEINDHELVHDDSGFSTETYVAVTVENTGEVPSGMITLDARWYSEGDYLTADTAYLQTLGAGETWLARVEYLGTGGEAVDDYELEYEVEPSPPTAPDGLELVESDIQVGEDEAIVEGRVENNTGDDQSYIEATVKFYNSDGAVLSDEWTNVTELPDGETWAFEIRWFALGRVEDIADYEIVIDTQV